MASRRRERERDRGQKRSGRSEPYHHGDLRAALLRAASELVAERGEAALSIRLVAARLGVSHAAPYHHFPSKEHLLRALAESGFQKLDATLEAALQGIPRDQVFERFAALGPAYVRFAAAEPSLFRLMFRAPKQAGGPGMGLGATAQRPFNRVREAARACLEAWGASASAGPAPADATQITMLAWASMHGLATLLADGVISSAPLELERRAAELAALVARLVQPAQPSPRSQADSGGKSRDR